MAGDHLRRDRPYMAAVVDIFSGRGVSLHAHSVVETSPKRVSYRRSYKPFLHGKKAVVNVTRRSALFIKVGVINIDVRVSSHIKEELAWVVLVI